MSRTYKDKPSRLLYDRYDKDFVYHKEVEVQHKPKALMLNELLGLPVEYPYKSVFRSYFTYRKTTKPKKRKTLNTKWLWFQRTPSWFTRITMNRPQRRKGKLWERAVLFQDIEETDPPGVGRKPHNYYY